MLTPKNSPLKSNWSIESQGIKSDQGFFFDLMSNNGGINFCSNPLTHEVFGIIRKNIY